MAERFAPGTPVTWTSQSGGSTRTKSGTVVAFIPSGGAVPYTERWPFKRPWKDHPLAGDATVCKTGSSYSVNDRYLVRVQQGPRSVALYAPIAAWVKEADNGRVTGT